MSWNLNASGHATDKAYEDVLVDKLRRVLAADGVGARFALLATDHDHPGREDSQVDLLVAPEVSPPGSPLAAHHGQGHSGGSTAPAAPQARAQRRT